MIIRPAHTRDLAVCFAIDDSFETEFVWQMEERVTPSHISVGFRLARLPRAMRVRNLAARDALTPGFVNGDAAFVAEDSAPRGYIHLAHSTASETAYVKRLVIAPAFRRQGIGTQLLTAAYEWARQQKLRAMMAHLPTKAHPAICFLQKRGFAFCGFNDQLFPNGDIAMYFALAVKLGE